MPGSPLRGDCVRIMAWYQGVIFQVIVCATFAEGRQVRRLQSGEGVCAAAESGRCTVCGECCKDYSTSVGRIRAVTWLTGWLSLQRYLS
eukprot:COSAG02_NODE_2113_length_9800_cov_53.566643_6_plen_89_part_00